MYKFNTYQHRPAHLLPALKRTFSGILTFLIPILLSTPTWTANGSASSDLALEFPTLDGTHKEYYADGTLMRVTTYRKGLPEGEAKTYYLNGLLKKKVFYKNGLLDGMAEEFYRDGGLKRRTAYHSGNPDGIEVEFYPDGRISRETHYKDGMRHGICKSFAENGVLILQENFETGRLNGTVKQFSTTGKLLREQSYRADKLDGPFRQYYPNGKISAEIEFSKNRASNVLREYHKNGTIERMQPRNNGILHGRALEYYPEGSLKKETIYEEGKTVQTRHYYKNGVIIPETAWGTFIKPADVNAAALNDPENFPKSLWPLIALLRAEIYKKDWEPNDFYADIRKNPTSSTWTIRLWHYDTFLDIHGNTLPNINGKNHTVYYDIHKEKIISADGLN